MTNREQDAERKHTAWDLRTRGYTYRQIASQLGIGHGTAERWCKEVMETKSLPLAEEVRKQEIDRLERYLRALDERIEDSDDKALALAIKVSERLCRMTGADMPTQIQVEKTETTQVDLAIQDLLSRQKAQNALRLSEAASLRETISDDVPSGIGADRLSEAIEDIIAEN